uniref:Uncharacterized protein n=1 Tax=Lepeophtheirus salmonis TaxID=72036 RepID=A0A0K2UVZ4_LEPSM
MKSLARYYRYIGIRDHLIPCLKYPLTYARWRFTNIKGRALLIRRSVREWAKLSHDTPKEV